MERGRTGWRRGGEFKEGRGKKGKNIGERDGVRRGMEKELIRKGNRVVIVGRMGPERRDKGRIRTVDKVRKKTGRWW